MKLLCKTIGPASWASFLLWARLILFHCNKLQCILSLFLSFTNSLHFFSCFLFLSTKCLLSLMLSYLQIMAHFFVMQNLLQVSKISHLGTVKQITWTDFTPGDTLACMLTVIKFLSNELKLMTLLMCDFIAKRLYNQCYLFWYSVCGAITSYVSLDQCCFTRLFY